MDCKIQFIKNCEVKKEKTIFYVFGPLKKKLEVGKSFTLDVQSGKLILMFQILSTYPPNSYIDITLWLWGVSIKCDLSAFFGDK